MGDWDSKLIRIPAFILARNCKGGDLRTMQWQLPNRVCLRVRLDRTAGIRTGQHRTAAMIPPLLLSLSRLLALEATRLRRCRALALVSVYRDPRYEAGGFVQYIR